MASFSVNAVRAAYRMLGAALEEYTLEKDKEDAAARAAIQKLKNRSRTHWLRAPFVTHCGRQITPATVFNYKVEGPNGVTCLACLSRGAT